MSYAAAGPYILFTRSDGGDPKSAGHFRIFEETEDEDIGCVRVCNGDRGGRTGRGKATTVAAVSWPRRLRRRRQSKAACGVRTRQEFEMESPGPQRPLLADRRRRQAGYHGFRRREAMHARL